MKKFTKILKTGLLVIAIALVGCNKDHNHNSHDDHNHDDHNHELEFSKVEFIFTEGHTHGASFHGDPTYKGVKYLVSQQKVTFTLENDKWVASNTAPIRWRQSSYYGLEIVYYNNKGERMNSEVVEESSVHQHFFQYTDIKAIRTGTVPANANDISVYTYRDTDPEDAYYQGTRTPNVKLLTNNPIGLKGYFHVKQNYLSFNLKISLAHFLSGSKLNNGVLRTYNELPSPSIAPSDFQVNIPIRIYNDRLNTDETIENQDIMEEFGITIGDVQAEREAILKGDVDTESSQVWM